MEKQDSAPRIISEVTLYFNSLSINIFKILFIEFPQLKGIIITSKVVFNYF